MKFLSNITFLFSKGGWDQRDNNNNNAPGRPHSPLFSHMHNHPLSQVFISFFISFSNQKPLLSLQIQSAWLPFCMGKIHPWALDRGRVFLEKVGKRAAGCGSWREREKESKISTVSGYRCKTMYIWHGRRKSAMHPSKSRQERKRRSKFEEKCVCVQ